MPDPAASDAGPITEYALGRNVDEFGRTEAHPAAPRSRDRLENITVLWNGPERESTFKPRAVARSLNLHDTVRRETVRGRTAHVALTRPQYSAGDRVTIAAHVRMVKDRAGVEQTEADPPLSVIITAVERAPLDGAFVTKYGKPLMGHAKLLGFARWWMDLHDPEHRGLAVDADGQADPEGLVPSDLILERWRTLWAGTTVWVTRWRIEMPHPVRLLASKPHLGPAYTSSSSRVLKGAGEAPPEDWMAERTESVQAEIAKALAKHIEARRARKAEYVSPSRRRMLEAMGSPTPAARSLVAALAEAER